MCMLTRILAVVLQLIVSISSLELNELIGYDNMNFRCPTGHHKIEIVMLKCEPSFKKEFTRGIDVWIPVCKTITSRECLA